MSTLEQSLKTLEDNLQSRYEGLVLWTSFLSRGDEYHPPIVRIMTVQIPSENRKQGLGSEVMSQIISWADNHGVMLSLSPSTDFGASSVSRLTKFYRRFGFKPNKGRNKDFRTRDTMLRNPVLRKNSSGKGTSYKMPRKWGSESKNCDDMGFSEKAHCRPYIDCYGGKTGSSRPHMNSTRYLESAKRDDPKLKNTGHGGLSTWFAGHGGGKPDERATWGDWIAITPIKHTVKKDGEPKTYEAGDIVGPCAISSQPSWRSVTDGGENPLKCMPRDKAHNLTKEQRATLARKKRREESKGRNTQKPVFTPTFSEEVKNMLNKKADFYRDAGLIRPPDDLVSHMTTIAEGAVAKWALRNRQGDVDFINPYALEEYLNKEAEVFKGSNAQGKYKEQAQSLWVINHDSLSRKIIFRVNIQEKPYSAGTYIWDGFKHAVVLFVDSSKKGNWNLRDLASIRGTIQHELVHVMQKEYAIKADLRDSDGSLGVGGLPFAKRDQRFTQRMRDKEKELRQIAREEGMNEAWIEIHALDDIEFYSRLLDEITDFKSWFKEYKAWHTNVISNEDIRDHIKHSKFFISLKRHKRKSWKKAVGLFVKAVGDYKDMVKNKSAARPIRIDKRALRVLTDQAWNLVVKRAELIKKAGLHNIGEVTPLSIFVDKVKVGDKPVTVSAEINEEKVGGGSFNFRDNSITIYISNHSISILDPRVRKFYDFESKFKENFLSVLEHEMTHAYDKILYHKNMVGVKKKVLPDDFVPFEGWKNHNARRYVNHSGEIKAFLQQIASESEEYLRNEYGLSRESIRDHFMESLNKSPNYIKIRLYLTPKNRKYIKSAVLTHLLEQVV